MSSFSGREDVLTVEGAEYKAALEAASVADAVVFPVVLEDFAADDLPPPPLDWLLLLLAAVPPAAPSDLDDVNTGVDEI